MRKKLLRSRTGFEKPESREEAIMQNILGASNVLEPAESNIEEILQAILYNTPYTKEPETNIEEILLAIKNNGTYTGECESRDMKILFAILNESTYNEEPESRIEELFIEWLYQRSSIKVLEGVPPLTFTSRGLPLINYLIEGNTVQNGTPTPDNPVIPQGCGVLDGSNWKNPISCGNQTKNINLSEVPSTRYIKELVLTGNETWSKNSGSSTNYLYYIPYLNILPLAVEKSDIICTHFIEQRYPPVDAIGINTKNNYNQLYVNFGSILNSQPLGNTPAGVKQFLGAQYAAGTPVTLYYVLTTAETGIVNAPLMKIGEYADTISMADTGIVIPTVRGNNVLTVDTAVQPSNVYIEYK